MNINELKQYEGYEVEYLYNDEYRYFLVRAVQDTDSLIDGKYRGDLGEVYLEYTNDADDVFYNDAYLLNEAGVITLNGFWTNKLNRFRIPASTRSKLLERKNQAVNMMIMFMNTTLTNKDGVVKMSESSQEIAKKASLDAINFALTEVMWLNLLCTFDNPMKAHFDDKIKELKSIKGHLLTM